MEKEENSLSTRRRHNSHNYLYCNDGPTKRPLNQVNNSISDGQVVFGQKHLFVYLILALEICTAISSPLLETEKREISSPIEGRVGSSKRGIHLGASSKHRYTFVAGNDSASERFPRSATNSAAPRVPTTRQLTTLVNDSATSLNNRETAAAKTKQRILADLSEMFREEIENYPDEEIRVALKKTPEEVKELYNVINTPLDPNMNLTERVAHYYSEDENDASREEHICRSVTRNIYPKEARRENSLVYVPNNQDFMQVIQAELCQNPEEECNYLSDNLPYGMVSICHQKYAYKKLMYFDSLKSRMASDLFRYPSCCACYVRTFLIDLRSAANQLANSSTSFKLSRDKNNNNNNNNTKATLLADGAASGFNKVPNASLGIEKLEGPAHSDKFYEGGGEASSRDQVSISKRLDKASDMIMEGEKVGALKEEVTERYGKHLHIVNDTQIIMNANGSKLKEEEEPSNSATFPASRLPANSSSNHRSQARAKRPSSGLKLNQQQQKSNPVNQTIILPEDKVYKSSNLH